MSRVFWGFSLLVAAIQHFPPLLYYWVSSMQLTSSVSWVFWPWSSSAQTLHVVLSGALQTPNVLMPPPVAAFQDSHLQLGKSSPATQRLVMVQRLGNGINLRVAYAGGWYIEIVGGHNGASRALSHGSSTEVFNKSNIKVTAQESMRGVGNLVFMISWERAESWRSRAGLPGAKCSSDTGSLTFRKLFYLSVHYLLVCKPEVVIVPTPYGWT